MKKYAVSGLARIFNNTIHIPFIVEANSRDEATGLGYRIMKKIKPNAQYSVAVCPIDDRPTTVENAYLDDDRVFQ